MISTQQAKLRKFLSYYKPYRGMLLADIVCAALVAAIALIIPICVRYVTKDVLEAGIANASAVMLRMSILMLALIAAQTVFAMFYDYKGHDMGGKIERDMRQELFTHFQKLSFGFFDNQKTGQLMSRLTNDLLNMAELYHHGPENLVIYGIEFIGALIILLCINIRLALVVCAFLPVLALYSFVFYRKLQKVYAKSYEHIADVNAQAEESLSGIRVIKSFANEPVEIDRFSVGNNSYYRSRSSIYKHEALYYTVMETFFMQLITVAVIVAGGIWIMGASMNFADLLIFILYVPYLTGPIPKLAFMIQQYQDGLAGYRRFREMIDTEPDIRDADHAKELRIVEGRVEFENVTFQYNEGQECVLRGIHVDVPAGQTIAVVGRSGAGKTTLCSLLPRFYDINAGVIRIDGTDIQDVTLSSLRRQIGVVQQETFLFAGTIMENILYGKPGATADEAINAAKKANAHEFIMTLPNGYDTDIGQRGVKLSGGQKQRISIARVFLKNPPILIFDEATSALDYESENAVMEGLRTLAIGRTTFVVAHRLRTVQNADRILVLTNDGIAEQGTHEQLLALNGTYARIYNMQAL